MAVSCVYLAESDSISSCSLTRTTNCWGAQSAPFFLRLSHWGNSIKRCDDVWAHFMSGIDVFIHFFIEAMTERKYSRDVGKIKFMAWLSCDCAALLRDCTEQIVHFFGNCDEDKLELFLNWREREFNGLHHLHTFFRSLLSSPSLGVDHAYVPVLQQYWFLALLCRSHSRPCRARWRCPCVRYHR